MLTFAVWSAEEVRMRQDGKLPAPQTMSVIGSEWSERLQYGVGRSFCMSSSSSLHCFAPIRNGERGQYDQ